MYYFCENSFLQYNTVSVLWLCISAFCLCITALSKVRWLYEVTDSLWDNLAKTKAKLVVGFSLVLDSVCGSFGDSDN